MTPNLTKEISKQLGKRLAETDALFGESLANESAPTTPTLTGADKLAAIQEHKAAYSVMTGIPQDLLFQSQAEYDAALAALPEPTHDANGDAYSNGDAFLLKLRDAAIKKALDPPANPDAEIHAQIHRDELMATPAQTTFEDAAHASTAPTTVGEWVAAAEQLDRLARQHGMFVVRIAGSQFPLSLGPGGAIREIEQLRLSTDPSGTNVLAQGSLANMRTALDFEIRDRVASRQRIALMEQYNEQKRAEYAEAVAERAKREAVPQTIEQLLSVVQELSDEVAALKSERAS